MPRRNDQGALKTPVYGMFSARSFNIDWDHSPCPGTCTTSPIPLPVRGPFPDSARAPFKSAKKPATCGAKRNGTGIRIMSSAQGASLTNAYFRLSSCNVVRNVAGGESRCQTTSSVGLAGRRIPVSLSLAAFRSSSRLCSRSWRLEDSAPWRPCPRLQPTSKVNDSCWPALRILAQHASAAPPSSCAPGSARLVGTKLRRGPASPWGTEIRCVPDSGVLCPEVGAEDAGQARGDATEVGG